MSVAALPLLLLAEDDDDVCEQTAQVLEDAGFTTCSARDGQRAIALLESGIQPAAIILDLMMPVMSGWDVWDWLQQSRFAKVPVIIWTATGLRQGSVGSARVIAKSVNPRELVDTIRLLTAGVVA